MKFIITLFTLLLLATNQLSAQAYAGPNDSPGWGPHDDYSLKPNFTEDRHRCEDKQIKALSQGFVVGSWNAEYTLTYMPTSVKKEGNIVTVYCKMFATVINQVSAGSSEGYIETIVLFNTRTNQMNISKARAVSCTKQTIGTYNQPQLWEPVAGQEIFNSFYKNVIKKI